MEAFTSVRSGRRVRFTLPDIQALGFKWPELAAAMADYQRMESDLDQAQADIGRLNQGLTQAQAADRAAYAQALREGKPDPGEQAVKRVQAERAAAERRRDALEVAVEEAQRDLLDTIEEHRAKWVTEVQAATITAREAYRKAVADVAAARQRWQHRAQFAAWLAKFPDGLAFSPASGHVRGLLSQGGDLYSADAVLGALQAEATSPPPAVPATIQKGR